MALLADAHSLRSVSLQLGIARSTLRSWRDGIGDDARPSDERCFVCAGNPCPDAAGYGYLLGQYLGDGHLVTSVRVPRLRISCADAYPEIAAEVDRAMHAVSGNRVGAVQSVGCSHRWCYWNHWPCVLPQHGPGRKHERPIVLEPWQQALVDADPWPLLRGLIHSDGCRTVNRVTVRGAHYAYPRYFFSNTSTDILAIAGRALDVAGVAWRRNRANSLSVARRDAVARMDERIGPKR